MTKLLVANIVEEGKLGGPQVRIVMAAAKIKNIVETIVVMPLENSIEFQRRCRQAGIKYKAMSISRITREWRVAARYLSYSLFEIIRIARFLKNNNFDIVHVSGGSWQYKGVLAGKIAGVKVIWHLNDTSMPMLIRYIFSIMSRFGDAFIFASEKTRDYYRPLLKVKRREFVIPAPVDITRFDPALEYRGEEKLLSKWQGKIVVGTVANINPIKGLEVFIRVAAELSHTFQSVFAVVGPVHKNQECYFSSLQALCRELKVDNIEFVGGRSDVRPLLKRFDVYICSSAAESSPISVWEAMSMAKPIVSTNVGDVPLYIKDNDNGYVVNVGDYKAIAQRVRMILSMQELQNEIGSRARKVAIHGLNVDICAAKHIAAYKAVLEDMYGKRED